MWTVNFLMCKLVLGKAEEPEIKLPTSAGLWKKQESSRKTSISALLSIPKPLTVWITINCGKFWKRWEYQTTWSASQRVGHDWATELNWTELNIWKMGLPGTSCVTQRYWALFMCSWQNETSENITFPWYWGRSFLKNWYCVSHQLGS